MENEKIQKLIVNQAYHAVDCHKDEAAEKAQSLDDGQKLKLTMTLTIVNVNGVIAVDGTSKLDKIESKKIDIDCLTFDPNQPDMFEENGD